MRATLDRHQRRAFGHPARVFLGCVLFLILSAAPAFADFGPHGPASTLDTDACAGCHRAHTSFATATWTDSGGNPQSGLLISSASTIQQFCFACHGNGAPGAGTNVEYGIFDSGASASATQVAAGSTAQADGTLILYETASSLDATLNGGGFSFVGASQAPVTSAHVMVEGSASSSFVVWGFGNSVSQAKGALSGGFTCTNCHDPHGSSNYRLLKDSLAVGGENVPVGGYSGTNPTPFVFSNEQGYPPNGWHKHATGAAEMSAYVPNYTTPEYSAKGNAVSNAPSSTMEGISGWCSGCHRVYDNKASAYDYGNYLAANAYSSPGASVTASQVGSRTMHRHPVGVPVDAGPSGGGILTVDPVTDPTLPLERNSVGAPMNGAWTTADQLGCLTCHRAHGTSVTETGWAQSEITTVTPAPGSIMPTWTVRVMNAGNDNAGVNPTFDSALLRDPNRGVCERCHNK